MAEDAQLASRAWIEQASRAVVARGDDEASVSTGCHVRNGVLGRKDGTNSGCEERSAQNVLQGSASVESHGVDRKRKATSRI